MAHQPADPSAADSVSMIPVWVTMSTSGPPQAAGIGRRKAPAERSPSTVSALRRRSRSFSAACSRSRGPRATALARISSVFTAGALEAGPRLGHGQEGARADRRPVLDAGDAGYDGVAGLDTGRPAGGVDVAQRPGDAGQPEALVEHPAPLEDAGDVHAHVARRGPQPGGQVEVDLHRCP